jgi:hypothetical protein
MIRTTGRVSLREITSSNRSEIEALAVTPAQELFVAGVADSLVQAAETPGACSRYPCAGDGTVDAIRRAVSSSTSASSL